MCSEQVHMLASENILNILEFEGGAASSFSQIVVEMLTLPLRLSWVLGMSKSVIDTLTSMKKERKVMSYLTNESHLAGYHISVSRD